jgi:hypothetical protein
VPAQLEDEEEMASDVELADARAAEGGASALARVRAQARAFRAFIAENGLSSAGRGGGACPAGVSEFPSMCTCISSLFFSLLLLCDAASAFERADFMRSPLGVCA